MNYNASQKLLEITVGELCFISHRSRDLDYSRSYLRYAEMQEGSAAHRVLAKHLATQTNDRYETECPLTLEYEYCGYNYRIIGRADGVTVAADGTPVTVDEYKSTNAPTAKKPVPIHKAQLYCYALMLSRQYGLADINARLIYCKRTLNDVTVSEEDAWKVHAEKLPVPLLEKSLQKLLDYTLWYIRHEELRQTEILPGASAIPFPYKSLRVGQSELIKECYRSIKNGKRFFVQAPTGIGKTVSVLYPAVRALSDGYCDKIFYLTAKSSTRKEAYNAAGKLFEVGAHIRTVILSAKSIMCRDPMKDFADGDGPRCDPVHCIYARGYNEKSKRAIDELLSVQNCFTPTAILKIAEKYKICPYELSLDLSELCDLIICDYNYVFDPTVYLRRYFSDTPTCPGKFLFLADEAHNLPDRARDMYSAELHSSALERIYTALPENEPLLIKSLGAFISDMYALKKLCRDDLTKDADGKLCGFWLDKNLYAPFVDRVRRLKSVADQVRGKYADTGEPSNALKLIDRLNFLLSRFARIADIFGDGFLNCIEFDHGRITIKLYCLDPSEVLDKCLSKAVSSVMFSATLTPPEYFADLLGCSPRNSVTLSLASPFPKENLCVVAATSVSTRYDDREKSVKKIANYIALAISHKIGNYIVYFPSYSYMSAVLEVFRNKYPNVPLLIQKPNMTADDRRDFIEGFPEDTGKMRVGFCVLGGSFSEGVDLPGTRLIGAIIIGVGLPGLSNERNIMRDHFQNKYECGYDYAYTYPGMNNVLQAAGRVIRTEHDTGVVLLIDDRYETPTYKALYPDTFSDIKFAHTPQDVSVCIRDFWQKNKK